MSTTTVRRFKDRLKEDLKNREFKKAFDEQEVLSSLAIQIAKIRHACGLSQKELAVRLHTTQQTVSRLEDPDNKSYSLNTLIKLARVFHKELQVQFV